MRDLVLSSFQQWLLLSGVAIAVGCVAWGVIVGPRASRVIALADTSGLRTIERRVASVGQVAAAALMGVWALRMGVQVMMFRDPFVPLSEDVSFLLFETFWGTVWIAQGIILPVLAVAFWRARRGASADAPTSTEGGYAGPRGSSGAWWAAAVLVLFLVATLALSSHAMGVETARPLIVAADGVHALAAGCWMGSLGLILTVGRPVGGSDESIDLFAAQLRSFSAMAIVTVSTLIVMGLVLSWSHLNTLSNLWGTTYGRVLAAKVGVAFGVFGLGLWNWRVGLRATDTEAGQTAIRSRAAWEVCLAGGVLVMTAVLVHMSKP